MPVGEELLHPLSTDKFYELANQLEDASKSLHVEMEGRALKQVILVLEQVLSHLYYSSSPIKEE